MTNFENIKEKVKNEVWNWLQQLCHQDTYDELYEVYNYFISYKSEIRDIIGKSICIHCDYNRNECTGDCNNNCKWLYDEYNRKTKRIKKNKEHKK